MKAVVANRVRPIEFTITVHAYATDFIMRASSRIAKKFPDNIKFYI